MYAILLALPEPVSKGIAALMTLGAMTYLGWDTVWRLIDGWLVLTRQVEAANGTPVRWFIAEEKLAGALRKMFKAERLDIEVVHLPPLP